MRLADVVLISAVLTALSFVINQDRVRISLFRFSCGLEHDTWCDS